jgi:hypothetical protein
VGHVLPTALLQSQVLFMTCKAVFVLAAGLWFFSILVPLSSWVAAGSQILLVGLYLEGVPNAEDHTKHIVSWLLVVHAMWFHLYRREMREARRRGRTWEEPLYPAWVPFLGVFSIGALHLWAGVSKIATSGPGWVNGASLQLWAALWGDPDGFLTAWIMSSRTFATVAQAVALSVECLAILGAFLPRARVPLGILLVAFHVGNDMLFRFGFPPLILWTLLYYLPADRAVGRMWPEPARAGAP